MNPANYYGKNIILFLNTKLLLRFMKILQGESFLCIIPANITFLSGVSFLRSVLSFSEVSGIFFMIFLEKQPHCLVCSDQ